MKLLELFGEKPKATFKETLFGFLKEIPINPFDETFEVRDKKGELVYTVTKKGMSLVLFNSLIEQLNKLNKKEKKEIDKIKSK